MELCLFDRPDDAARGRAHPAPRAHRLSLARLPARRAARPAVRLSGARPLRARARATASIPPSCCSIPTPRPSAARIRWSDALSGYTDRRPRATTWSRDTRDSAGGMPKCVVVDARVHLGRRPAAAHALEPDGDLRVPREGDDHAAIPRCREELRGTYLGPGRRPIIEHLLTLGRHRGRAAAGPPVRGRAAPGRAGPDQLLGLQLDRVLRPGRPLRHRRPGRSR